MNEKIENIRIEWNGPYSLTDIGYDEKNMKYTSKDISLNDKYEDFGIYQVYGCHPIYGNDVLLYIGQAAKRTFSKRLSEEGWEGNEDHKNIKFYVGRLFAEKQPSSKNEWYKMIDQAERMLIYAHEPARNSSNILNVTKNKDSVRIFL